jgi:chromosome segregation ATPase
MRNMDGRTVLMQLIAAYREESALYAGLEDAAVQQNSVLRNGRDPARLDQLMERQRELAEQIGQIESGIAPLREHWEQVRDNTGDEQLGHLSSALDSLLAQLTDRIHRIVAVEKENSQALVDDMVPHEV